MPRILVIDDDQLIREFLSIMLEEAGLSVAVCENGRKGIAEANREPPDMVITDVYMPEVDGLEVIRELRQNMPLIPIIAISGAIAKDTPNYLNVAKEFGANEVLYKPFNPEQITRLITRYLGLSSRAPILVESPCGMKARPPQ